MRTTFIFFASILLFTSCEDDPFTTTCYEVNRERGGRTTVISVTVTTDGNQASGSQTTTVTDDSGKVVAHATGTFKGTCLNATCLVDYHYESEGLKKVAEEEFLITPDKLLMTAGSYRYENGKEYMKERGLFNVEIPEINCP